MPGGGESGENSGKTVGTMRGMLAERNGDGTWWDGGGDGEGDGQPVWRVAALAPRQRAHPAARSPALHPASPAPFDPPPPALPSWPPQPPQPPCAPRPPPASPGLASGQRGAACPRGAAPHGSAGHLPRHAVHAQGAGRRPRLLQDGAGAALQAAQNRQAAYRHHLPHRRQLQAAALAAESGDPGPGDGSLRTRARQYGLRLLLVLYDGGAEPQQEGYARRPLHRHEGSGVRRAVHVPTNEAIQGARHSALRVGQSPALHRVGVRRLGRRTRRGSCAQRDLQEAGSGLLTECTLSTYHPS